MLGSTAKRRGPALAWSVQNARFMKTALLLGSLLLAATGLACTGTSESEDGEGSAAAVSGSLPVERSFANIAMRLPQDWDVHAIENKAFLGVLAGGPSDTPLRVQLRHEDTIESLAPKDCYREGGSDPVAVRSIQTVETGFRPIGDKTADYRRFRVTCADGEVSEHQAWRLPVSKIAIYEQHARPTNAQVVSAMQVSQLKEINFQNITFSVPSAWGLYRDGDHASLGVLAGGPQNVALSLRANFTGTVESLAPTDCYHDDGTSIGARSIETMESGLAQMGDGTKADYRQFLIHCADGNSKTHRAWVLPISKIAIYENVGSIETGHVIRNAQVRR